MISDIESIAKSYFHNDMNPAHDWFHVKRVEANADLLTTNYPEADETVVQLSVLLHDIGRAMEDRGEVAEHAEWGAIETERILENHRALDTVVDEVTHSVRAHRFSSDIEPASIEAKILSDADNLDAVGAVGLSRCFTYGGERGSTIYDPSLPPEADESSAGLTQFNHIQKKLIDIPDRMFTDLGIELAEARCEFIYGFIQQFEDELAGRR